MHRRGERGQALVMVAAALGIFLLGAVGLATDVGQLYAHRQMAQSAADAGAQAGIMSIFNGTNTGANAFGSGPFTCGAGDARTPCQYAFLNLKAFNGAAGDTVSVEFPAAGSVPGVPNSVSLIRVTVSRNVPTTFMRLLGRAAGTVAASATAAVLEVQSPVPIIIVHPTLPASFYKHGSNNIIICGGPEKSIQVNSNSAGAVSIDGRSGVVDLSGAGPDTSSPLACDGSGGDFGNHGGPSPYPGTLLLGDTGQYIAPASVIPDPLLGVPAPEMPSNADPYRVLAPGTEGCPATLPAAAECRLYKPGKYTGGITLGQSNKVFAFFQPGIYYLDGGGFHLLSNSIVRMAESPNDIDPTGRTTWTNSVMFYNTGNGVNDIIDISANSGQINNLTFPTPAGTYCESGGNCLIGAPNSLPYFGMLFFQDRSTTALLEHSIWGGGGLTLMGTIYLTHTAVSTLADGSYQKLELGGAGGGVTRVIGQIIVDVLNMGGTSDIQMTLNPQAMFVVRQVALVR
ncbi:MAG TPA: pilus assembly protein TadG-related protein [Bryobacteraceae bacterium]|nr:pilus assembly protein TadG-related protein [Bryobacteraceae bacterium]